MYICQRIALDPTPEQIDVFTTHAAAARIARNDLIALWRDEGQRLPGFRLTKSERMPYLNAHKFEAHPWFKECSQNAVKGGYMDAEDAIARFHNGQNRRPRFHGKSRRMAFRADNGTDTIRLVGKRLTLPAKLGGVVKTLEALRWNGNAIRSCRISERAGRWFASVRVKITEAEYGARCGRGIIGIDLGLKTFATIAYEDGRIEKVNHPQPMRYALRRIAAANRRLSRRVKGSAGWHRAKRQLAKAYCRLEQARGDFLHKLSHRLTAAAETIRLETLSIKGWQRHKRWGRKVNDLALAEFVRQLAYKANWRGGSVEMLDRAFPSTQICSDCGHNDGPKALNVREWACTACGSVHDRDANAAVNIRDCDELSARAARGRRRNKTANGLPLTAALMKPEPDALKT